MHNSKHELNDLYNRMDELSKVLCSNFPFIKWTRKDNLIKGEFFYVSEMKELFFSVDSAHSIFDNQTVIKEVTRLLHELKTPELVDSLGTGKQKDKLLNDMISYLKNIGEIRRQQSAIFLHRWFNINENTY